MPKTTARTRTPPAASADSPMIKQYKALKAQHPDKLLFFRMGDFYEMFFEDAHAAARALGITLTSRQKGPGGPIPMAGVPVVSATNYVARALKAGFRVAIAEQVEDPATAKGLVDRKVTEVVTPGTLVDERLLDATASNFLLAASEAKGGAVGLAWLDLSTGRFRCCDVEAHPVVLRDEIARIAPAETLLPETRPGAGGAAPGAIDVIAAAVEDLPGGVVTRLPGHVFARDDGRRRVLARLGVASLEGFDCEELGPALGAAGALLRYVEDTNAGFLETVRRIERHDGSRLVRLDRSTLRGLEVMETARERDRRGSLLGVMDRTCTPPGARLLREWLAAPLRDVGAIRARHDAVAALIDAPARLRELRDVLGKTGDIERIATRVAGGRGGPRDLSTLRDGLARLPAARAALDEERLAGGRPDLLESILLAIDPLDDVERALRETVVEEPPAKIEQGGIVRDGVDAELDEARALAREGRDALARLQKQEIERTGIPTLKVGYNRVFGYYIEVTNAHKSRVPDAWVRRQTLKNAERYVTEELKDFEARVLTAKERAGAIEERIVGELRAAVGAALPRLLETSAALAELDVLACFADIARERRYCRPSVDEGEAIRIVEGRHPVLDAASAGGEPFVGNDITLGGEDAPLLAIITGPNMAGKSTYIRQAALLVLMAQAGSFVPAESAEIGACDRVFARVGAADDLARGLSTFMVEMTEAALILNHATARSLLVLDEVGRGTSTYDGVAIAWAIAEHLHERVRARTLFATHYHELVALEEQLPRVRAFNVAVREWQGEIVFLRKIAPGGADRSYGVHVARLAGVPQPVLERARAVLEGLESSGIEATIPSPAGEQGEAGRAGGAPATPSRQLSLFRAPSETIIDEIAGLDLDRLAPLDALLAIRKWQESIGPAAVGRARR